MTQPHGGREPGPSSGESAAGNGIDMRLWSPRLRWLVLAIASVAFVNGALIGPMLRGDDIKDGLRQAIEVGQRCVSGWKETTDTLKRTEMELARLRAAPRG